MNGVELISAHCIGGFLSSASSSSSISLTRRPSRPVYTLVHFASFRLICFPCTGVQRVSYFLSTRNTSRPHCILNFWMSHRLRVFAYFRFEIDPSFIRRSCFKGSFTTRSFQFFLKSRIVPENRDNYECNRGSTLLGRCVLCPRSLSI